MRPTNTNTTTGLGTATGRIYLTRDYDMFTSIDGNRRIRPAHFDKLKRSMEEELLISPLCVNEKLQVIDGQHRLACLKALGEAVHYYICEGYGLDEVHRMNTTLAAWTPNEFMDAYADDGREPYMQYRTFVERWKFQHKVAHKLLKGSVTRDYSIEFASGRLTLTPNERLNGDRLARRLYRTGKYYEKGWRRRSYVYAMCRCFENPVFNFEEFLKKLKIQPTKLQDCGSVDEYLKQIEVIYNYHRGEKVRLY